MSKQDDKDLLKDRKADDKTIVQFAGARTHVWPATDDEDTEAGEDIPKDAVEADAASSPETEEGSDPAIESEARQEEPASTDIAQIPDDTIWSQAPETPTPIEDASAVETIKADTIKTDTSELPEPELHAADPFNALDPSSFADPTPQEPPSPETGTRAEADKDEEPRETAAPALSDAELEPAEDNSAPPPEAPRIEVPVQQQFASLLAALSDRIEQHPGGHDLLAVLRMLEGQTAPGGASTGMDPKKADEPAPPRIGKSRRLMEDIVRFGQDPSSEFAPSTIERATRDADGGLVLLERFLGLLGPQGGLPAPYTDEAIMRGLRGDDSFPRFLDVFNNRFVQLFFRAWADARPIVQHDRPDDDRFLTYLGSPIGLGAPIYRDQDRIDDRLKLLYAGLTSSKTKSAVRLKALITGVFGVKVEVDQCVGTWLHLDRDDQLQLGGFGPGGAGQLGADTIVGAKVYSVSDKIRIRIFTRSLEEYRKFLPPTRTKPNPWTEKLFDLIDFYLGLEIEYEIELALPKRCASSVKMDRNSSATLGHIGWLKPATDRSLDEPEDDEEMLTDTRFRPVRRHTTVYQ